MLFEQIGQYKSFRAFWEVFKLDVCGSSVQYSSRKKKSDTNKVEDLEKKLKYWQTEQEEIGIFPKVEDHIRNIKKDFTEIYMKRTQGAMIRCEARWHELGERPTKMFLNMEKSNFNKKTILRLKNKKGQILQQEDEIFDEINNFYAKLYRKPKDPLTEEFTQTYFDNIREQVPKISANDHDELEKVITIEELGLAIKELKNGKCPGIDGLPIEWYKVFWGRIKSVFHKVVTEILETEKLHLSARRGLITLLEKLERDPLFINNWRPISLLCSDYKIFAKVIALRFQKVLPKLIHKSQTGFMKGRHIGENILKLQTVMDFCEKNEKEAVVISVDFEKAFDSIRWDAIDKALQLFGYGINFRNMISILHNDIWCTTLNNGKCHNWIKIGKGCRQGCPASALIFVQMAEILGAKIRANVNIRGIEINGEIITACQYADDLWVSLDGKKAAENIDSFLEEMREFQIFSGLKMNYLKSKAIRVGPMRIKDAQFITKEELAWTQDPVKILGIWFHYDQDTCYKLNFERTLQKCQITLNTWKSRNLSWLGKIAVINSLIA